jgi:hypothetical protein
MEGYEDEAHPETVDWFRSPDDPLSDHPVLKPHGHELARGAFDFTKKRLTDKGVNMHEMMNIFMRVERLERAHRDKLVELAKRVTAKVWKIGEEQLDAQITDQHEVNVNDTDEHDFGSEPAQPDDRVKQHTHMRATMNILMHGAAVHNMMTIHYMVRDELNAISPDLLSLYDKLAVGATHQYWFMAIRQMAQMLRHMVAGSAHVEYDDASDEPKVVARSVCFPVLCQELSKGVMMLLSNHHLGKLDRSTAVAVLKNADRIDLEPWYIMVGPELWRKFNAVISQLRDVTPAEAVAAFANMEPEQAHKIITTCIRQPKQAAAIMQRIIDEFVEGGD